jgi:hypothetical protein
MAKQPEKNPLVTVLDEMFLQLKGLTESPTIQDELGNPAGWPNEGTARNEPDSISFGDRLRLFEAGLKWCSVRDKVAEEQEGDAFAAARERLVRRTGSHPSRPAKAAPGAANGAAGATPAPDHTTD